MFAAQRSHLLTQTQAEHKRCYRYWDEKR